MGAQKALIQKTYETNGGQDSLDIEFLGANRQFGWIELSLAYNKCDKHTTKYDSYNVEMTTKKSNQINWQISLKFTAQQLQPNKQKKHDIDNLTQKHLLYKQFSAWSCNGSSVVPFTDYINNPVYQELIDEDNYFSVTSDARIYLDIRASSG